MADDKNIVIDPNEKKDVAATVPVYTFADEGVDADGNEVAPINRKIAKTMEITETFTAMDVMKYMANLKKQADDKRAEADGIMAMYDAYVKEMEVVEKQIGVTKMQDDYQQEVAIKNEHINDSDNMDKIVEEGVPSPYPLDNGEETNV